MDVTQFAVHSGTIAMVDFQRRLRLRVLTHRGVLDKDKAASACLGAAWEGMALALERPSY